MLALAASFLLVSPGAALAQDRESENRLAAANSSYVETAPPGRSRRILEGLSRLREGDARQAFQKLAPVLNSSSRDLSIPWGPRETRNFFTALSASLRACPEAARTEFLAPLEAEATKILRHTETDTASMRAFVVSYEGTKRAAEVRRMLVDRALERGDWLLAASQMARLPEPERKARSRLLARLRDAALGHSPWPYAHGTVSGRAGTGATHAPKNAPVQLPFWSDPKDPLSLLRRRVDNPRTAGVVGRTRNGKPFAVFQDPFHLFRVFANGDGFRSDRVDLEALLKLGGGRAVLPSPSLVGNRLFFVHGVSAPSLHATRSHPTLVALDVDGEPAKLRPAWTWSPDSTANPVLRKAELLPYALATGRRVFVLLAEDIDRVTIQVSAACLSDRGKLLWVRRIAKGAVLTTDIIESRQEMVTRGRHRPAPMVFGGGRLIVATGVGVLAALDPIDGTMLWSFKTARLRSLGGTVSPWEQGVINVAGGTIQFTPSDGEHFYRLHVDPGLGDLLVEVPTPKRSLVRFLGVAPARGAAYFFRRGLMEAGPLRVLLDPGPDSSPRYDAPPMQSGEKLTSTPLLTETSLVIATNKSLYWLDLAKDLFYEGVIPLRYDGRTAIGPAVPFMDGVLLAGTLRPILWR